MVASHPQYTHDVFVSHSSCDKAKARQIAECLKDKGLRVWFDAWSIPIGADITATIEDGLQNSRTLLLCLSKSSLASDWVHAEKNTILFRDPMNRERRLIPVLIDDCCEIIPDVLRRFRYADLRTFSHSEIQELCKVCRPPKDKAPTPVWRVKIEGNLADFDKQRLDKILNQLRELSDDFDVVLRRMDPGSVVLSFDGSLVGFQRIRELFLRGELSTLVGESVESIEITGEWTESDIDRTIPIYELLDQASAAYQRRNYDAAEHFYLEALRLARQIAFKKPVGSIYCNLGFVHENRGELVESKEMHQKALEADEETDNKQGIAKHCKNLGRIYQSLGESEIGQNYSRRALALFQELGDQQQIREIEDRLRRM